MVQEDRRWSLKPSDDVSGTNNQLTATSPGIIGIRQTPTRIKSRTPSPVSAPHIRIVKGIGGDNVEIDMDAFPLLPLEQIAVLPLEVLHESRDALGHLIVEQHAQMPSSSVLEDPSDFELFAAKQIHGIEQELVKRQHASVGRQLLQNLNQ